MWHGTNPRGLSLSPRELIRDTEYGPCVDLDQHVHGFVSITALSLSLSKAPISGRRYQTRDPIVSHDRTPSPIPIVGAEVQEAVRTGHDITNAAELSLEQAFLADDSPRCGIDSNAQQMRAAQSPDKQVVRELGEPLAAIKGGAARRDRGVVERNRFTHARHRLAAFDARPSVVDGGIDDVDFVVACCAMLRLPEIAGCRMPIDPLRIPVA